MRSKALFLLLASICFLFMQLLEDRVLLMLIASIVPLTVTQLIFRQNLLNLNCIVGVILLLQGIVGLQTFKDDSLTLGTSLSYQLPGEYATETFFIFFLSSSLCFLAGIGSNGFTLNITSLKNVHLSSKMELLLLLPAVGVVLSGGISSLIYRSSHLYGSKDSIFTHIFSLLSLMAPAVLAFIGHNSPRSTKLRYGLYICVYIFIFFSLGSRKLAFAVLLLFFLPGMRTVFRKTILSIVGLLVSMTSISLSLFLRGLQEQGLVSYLMNIRDFSFVHSINETALGNVVGGFPITGISAFLLPSYPKWHLLVEINPLWGGPAGWYRIAPFHSINAYTPSSGLGDLWNYGPMFFFLFWIAFSIGLLKIQESLDSNMKSGSVLFSAFALSLFFFSTSITQYSLRASLRAIYYLLFLQLVWFVYKRNFTSNIPRRKRN